MDTNSDRFVLGNPSLVCRWRLANSALPLENRHMRALAARQVNGERLPHPLVAWVKQHIEWTLADGAHEHPDGVLMLLVDEAGCAAMSCGPYEPLVSTSANDLAQRARTARVEAGATRVSPEDLWLVRGDGLVWATEPSFVPSGSSSLMADLAYTLGMPVQRDDDLLDTVATIGFDADEVFLVSDEHGVVPASDRGGRRAEKFAQSYRRLFS